MSETTSLADPVVRGFLRRSYVVQLATLSPKRRPFLTPVWFVVDGHALYIPTGPGTWAGNNVTHNPGVTLMFSGERLPQRDRVLRVRGTATGHAGGPGWRVLLRLAVKYYLSPRALASELRNVSKWKLRRRFSAQVKGGFGYVRVVPTLAEFLPRH